MSENQNTNYGKNACIALKDNPKVLEQSSKYKTISLQNNTLEAVNDLPQEFDGLIVWRDIFTPARPAPNYNSNIGAFYIVKELVTMIINIYAYRVYYLPRLIYSEVMLLIDKPPNKKDENIPSCAFTGQEENPFVGYSLYDILEQAYIHGFVGGNCISYNSLVKAGVDPSKAKTFEDKMVLRKKYIEEYNINAECTHNYPNKPRTQRRFNRIDGLANIGTGKNTLNDSLDIKTEIYNNGPVLAGMLLYDNMQNWNGDGIYNGPAKDSKFIGGLPLFILGWGSDINDIPFWQCYTPWGFGWGHFGFCKIRIGIPECMLEKNVIAVYPELPNNKKYHLNMGLANPELNKGRVKTGPPAPYTMSIEQINLIKEHKLAGRLGSFNPEESHLIKNKDELIDIDLIKAANIFKYNYEFKFKKNTERNVYYIITFCLFVIFVIFLFSYSNDILN